MTMISKLAFAAMLAAGTTLGTPALAKDKPAAKAPGMKLSPAVVKLAKPAQDALAAQDAATAEPMVAQIEAAATNDDDKYVGAVLRYNLEVVKLNAAQKANPNAGQSEAVLAKPLDVLIANPSTPAADRGKYYFGRARLAYNGKQYPVAVEYFTKARDLGYTDPQIGLFLTKAKIESGDIAGGTADLEKTIADMTARGEKAPEDYYRYAIARSNKARLKPQTISWLSKYAAAYPNAKTWYEVLATYGFQQDAVEKLDNQQKLDLFRLMRASGGLADQYFYLEYAQKAQNSGLPMEAQAVLREGIANGKIPAANTEAKAMSTEIAQAIRNEGSMAAIESKSKAAANGTLAMQTADGYLGQGNYAKAVELYRLSLTKGGVDANIVNSRLGIALARSGDKAAAKTAFAAVSGTPRADIASFWTTWLDTGPTA